MSSVFDWSVTANNNSNSDSGINWVEGQLPGTVNGSARAMMGRVAEIVKDLGGALTAGGSANALTITANSAFTTNVNGRFLAFRAASDNSAAATLNVNGIGAKSIRKMTSSGDSALVGAEIQADGIYLVNYSEALNGAAGGWLLINPTTVIDAATTSAAGIVELATDAEAISRSDTARAVTPANLAAAIGPASSTDNAVARYDGTSGKHQNSGVLIDDSNAISTVKTSAGTILSLQSTDAGAGSGPNVDLYRNSASPAASDLLSQMVFYGNDSGGNLSAYAEITGQIIDPTNGSEDGQLYIATIANGVYAIRFTVANGTISMSGVTTITGNTTINGTLTVTG